LGVFKVVLALARQRRAEVEVEDDDERLVARFRAGEIAAFDSLVKRYQRPVFYLVLRYLKNEADAQDVAQRAFVQAFERVRSLKREAAFKTWVYRIAVNLALNAIRDGARERKEPLVDEPEAPMKEPLLEAEEERRLRGALEKLPPKQRVVVELRIYEELSFKEVGKIADCSEDSAKANYHHALKRLRAMMVTRPPDAESKGSIRKEGRGSKYEGEKR
jgi:RNA polymerase sigma-70 factor (ECF subfamily)